MSPSRAFSWRIRSALATVCLCVAAPALDPPPSLASTASQPQRLEPTESSDTSHGLERSWGVDDSSLKCRVLHMGNASLNADFDLGAHAEQREGQWYTVRLRARVRVPRFEAGSKPATLAATVNGRSGVTLTLTPMKDSVRVFYNGAFGGAVNHYKVGEVFTVDYRNYVQDHAIKSGVNRFSVKLIQEGASVKEVIVDPVTGLTRTGRALKQIAVQVTPPVRSQEGETIDLPYSVTRRGQRSDGPATVSAEVVSGGAVNIVKKEHNYPSIGAGRRGQFKMTAKRGRYVVRVLVRGDYNPAAEFVTVDVRPADTSMVGRAAPLVAAGALAVLGVVSVTRPGARVRRWLPARRNA